MEKFYAYIRDERSWATIRRAHNYIDVSRRSYIQDKKFMINERGYLKYPEFDLHLVFGVNTSKNCIWCAGLLELKIVEERTTLSPSLKVCMECLECNSRGPCRTIRLPTGLTKEEHEKHIIVINEMMIDYYERQSNETSLNLQLKTSDPI